MSLTATTLPALEALFVAQIEGTTPRITYKGAEGWKHYSRAAEPGSRTRRFRMLWEPGGYFPRGIFTNDIVECSATLRVRTDYAGVYEKIAHLAQDDWHQLRERMQQLSATASNGLVLVQTTDRLAFPPESDVIQIDLTYSIRYVQSRT